MPFVGFITTCPLAPSPSLTPEPGCFVGLEFLCLTWNICSLMSNPAKDIWCLSTCNSSKRKLTKMSGLCWRCLSFLNCSGCLDTALRLFGLYFGCYKLFGLYLWLKRESSMPRWSSSCSTCLRCAPQQCSKIPTGTGVPVWHTPCKQTDLNLS